MKPVLLDTGVIVALLDRAERHHEICASLVTSANFLLASCEAVIAESCYLLRHLPGAAEAVLENVERGVFHLPMQLSQTVGPVRGLLRKYRDTPADLADACLIQLADQLNTGDILTLDRHFEHYRWRKNRFFNLLVPAANRAV